MSGLVVKILAGVGAAWLALALGFVGLVVWEVVVDHQHERHTDAMGDLRAERAELEHDALGLRGLVFVLLVLTLLVLGFAHEDATTPPPEPPASTVIEAGR